MKEFIKLLLNRYDLFAPFLLRREGGLYAEGWFRSYREKVPVNLDGDPIPWMTYAGISFIDKKINKEMTVFEYGCGNSTLWWANRTKHVISCEHNRQWYDRMKSKVPSNVELHHVDLQYGGAYSKKVSEYARILDIVVIDGRDRINCALNCLNALKDDGVIIWDNSERECYDEGYKFLLDNKFKRIDFEGMGPVNHYSWRTSIFYKNENCLNI